MAKLALILALFLAVAQSAPAVAAEPKAKTETTYYALYINGFKVGYMKDERMAADGRVTSKSTNVMSMKRQNTVIEMSSQETEVETAAGKPLRFDLRQKESLMVMTVSGSVDDQGQMTVATATGGLAATKKTETKPYPAGALMPEGVRLLCDKKGLKPGTKYEYLAFDAESRQASRVEVAVGKKETITLFGRMVEAIRQLSILHAPGGDVTSFVWVNEEGGTLRSEGTEAGMPVVTERCSQSFALSPAQNSEDFFSALLLPCPQAIPDEARKMTLTLKGKNGTKPALLETDMQKVKANEDGTVTLTVERPALPAGQGRPYDGKNAAALEALKPARYVQSDDALIVKKAREIVGSEKDAATAALKLAGWVYKYIEEKDLNVANASASEVIRHPEGDCKEHSVLLAALCRAAGIPARMADGYLFVARIGKQKNVFAGHQWTQVYLGGKWYDLDATLEAPHNSPGRITLAVGDGSENDLGGLNAMGSFTITSATAQ